MLKLEGTAKIILFPTFVLHMWKLEIQKDGMTFLSCTQCNSIKVKTKPCVLFSQARGSLYNLMYEQTPTLYANFQFCIIKKNSKKKNAVTQGSNLRIWTSDLIPLSLHFSFVKYSKNSYLEEILYYVRIIDIKILENKVLNKWQIVFVSLAICNRVYHILCFYSVLGV